MIQIKLYSFNKRENSTKIPTGGTVVTGDIKAPTSMINPTIEFATGTVAPANLNYAYIEAFGRYYFIDDWVFNDRTWTARMKVDVLASYKNVIGASQQYVLRSSSLWNDKITDGLYPMTNLVANNIIDKGRPFFYGAATSGYYVLSTVGSDSMGTGACIYVLTAQQMRVFMTSLCSTEWYSVEGIANNLMKAIANPLTYINSCFYIPLTETSFTTYLSSHCSVANSIKFGFWEIGMDCLIVKGRGVMYEKEYTFSFTTHPQSNRGEWVNINPYTERVLHLPSVGIVNLAPYVISGFTGVKVTYKIDIITGSASVVLESFRGVEDVFYSQIGIPIQLTQKTVDYFGAMSAIMGTATSIGGGVATGNYAEAVIGGAEGVMNTLEALQPQPSRLGGSGCFNFTDEKLFLAEHFHYLADDDLSDRGRPLCNDVRINTLSGYIIVADADIEITGTSYENTQIKSYMESGFFYE